MMFAYMMLASAFVIGIVLGSPVTEYEVSYDNLEVQTLDETATASTEMEQSVSTSLSSNGDYERSSNLKYVMAIQKSSIWTDVKKRTMTISSHVNGEIINKSPDTMSDQELAQLKQACHDGLKCVAVDQLLILKTIKQSTDGGTKMGVRTAITKITKVLTEYTTEYHEDTYEYFEVTETDDPSKVYQSVTTIVEDNRELCKINVNNPSSSDDSASYNASESYDGSASYSNSSLADSDSLSSNGSSSDNSFSSNDNPSNPDALMSDQQKQIFQNFGTVNNYNINQGTINEANVTINPSKPETQDQGTNTNNTPDVVIKLGEENEKKPEVNYQNYSSPQDDGSPVDSLTLSQPDTSVAEVESFTPQTEASANKSSASNSDDDLEDDKSSSLNVTNTNAGGCGDTNVDLASSGSSNQNKVLKGYVDKGNLNNGDMKVYNINKGTINEGNISKSNANNGIISVGNINKGPITYDYYNDFSNNNTESTLNNVNVQQYIADIDKMYSTILESLH